MKMLFLNYNPWATATLLLAAGLASCSRGPEQSAAAPSSAPVRAEALAPVPAAAPLASGGARVGASPATSGVGTATAAPEVTVDTGASAGRSAAPAALLAAPAAPAKRVPTYAQAGRVLDESGQPLVGATVLLRGTTYGTSTDITGGYLLEIPRGQNTLIIGYAGYEDETASSHDGQPLTTTLLPVPAASPAPPAKGRRGRR